MRFANLENKLGDKERSQTLFVQILNSYPKRVDVWFTYVDSLVKSGEFEIARCEARFGREYKFLLHVTGSIQHVCYFRTLQGSLGTSGFPDASYKEDENVVQEVLELRGEARDARGRGSRAAVGRRLCRETM